jgi:Rad3-related DNA helicase
MFVCSGINFKDGLARCVIMIGLPYPSKGDPVLAQKMASLDLGAFNGERCKQFKSFIINRL